VATVAKNSLNGLCFSALACTFEVAIMHWLSPREWRDVGSDPFLTPRV